MNGITQAIVGITEDYVTSENHHPGYVLIPTERFDRLKRAEAIIVAKAASQGEDAVRDTSGETVCGFRVAAWRETHPEHGDKYGHTYCEHWSTLNTRDPLVKIERLFTEDQLRDALAA